MKDSRSSSSRRPSHHPLTGGPRTGLPITQKRMPQRPHLVRWSLTLSAIAAWAFTSVSLLSFSATDWPSHAVYPWGPTHNLCGPAGAWIAYHAYTFVGSGAIAVLFFGAIFLGMKIWGQKLGDIWLRAVGLVLVAASIGAITHLFSPSSGGMPEGSGGIVGIATSAFLRSHFSGFGTSLVLLVAFLLGVLLAADELVIRMPVYVGGAYRAVKSSAPKLPTISLPEIPKLPSLPRFVTRDSLVTKAPKVEPTTAIVKASRTSSRNRVAEIVEDGAEAMTVVKKARRLKAAAEAIEAEAAQEMVDQDDVVEIAEALDVVGPEAEDVSPAIEAIADAKKPIIVRLAAMMPTKRTAPPPPKELGEYQMPGWDHLAEAEHGYAESQEKYVREKAAVLEQALTEFGIDAHVVEIDTGPVITMYELALAAGIRVSAITALTNDIARSLSAVSIRIIAPVPGKNTVGIEVPNAEKEKVRMKELMQTAPEKAQKFAIPLYLGKDASGAPLVVDLAAMPHCLIAGTTGSGKSVCINSIIMSIMYTQRPDMVKLILVDPKVVEMAPFKDIPHLMCPVITESAKATSVLEWACEKMEERYAVLADAGVKNLAGYNALTKEELFERLGVTTPEDEAKVPKKMPYMVIVIDELADLMMTSGKEVESHIVRISQKARAVGIHLVLATQRPQATVVTGLIKANMPCKIAFRVSSRMDSRIVLDMNGAEVLLGQGDMLYLANGASKPTRCQGTYIDDKEVKESVKMVKQLADQQFEPDLVQIRNANLEGEAGERDPLFDDAVRIVLETKRGSVSLLQRRLTIGYGRASRIVEEMAAAGILGEHKGSQAREPIITLDEWEAAKAQQRQDEEEGMTV
jgi:DNA segregation ATPase FtsK/SpoIIIE, S-DNA-T family